MFRSADRYVLAYQKYLFSNIDTLNCIAGSLSEEALEASHKIIRKVRLSHTRKNSRQNTNKDLLTHLIISSHPGITSKRHKMPKLKHSTINDLSKYILNDSRVETEDDVDPEMTEVSSSDNSSDE